MKFWDSSALVPLLIEEEVTAPLRDLYLGESGAIVWWGTPVECASAVSRVERENRLSSQKATEAVGRLDALARHWHRIEPVDAILEMARRLLRVHPLRAADSLQLAAAVLASEGSPSTLEFVCLDDRLGVAAQREGFLVRDRSSL
ncbi:MAG TPA: type II toxin-antitoxin system VapC family toxin [Thermoanaerobaculia bacterium]|nr:type II toxin-antitoxin system VapC family toxin [Thermoanaerobaculia bacterium]